MPAFAIPAIIAAAALAAAGGAAAAGVKASKENEARGTWEDYLRDLEDIKVYKPRTPFKQEFDLSPEIYQLPEDIQFQIADLPPEDRQRVLDSIGKFRDLAEGKVQSRTDFDRARTQLDASQEASAREQSVLSEGLGATNPGLAALIRAQGGQQSATRNLLGGLQANAQAGQERLQAGGQYADAIKNLYDTDLQQKNRNTDILNRAAELNAERRRQINERNIDLKNFYNRLNTENHKYVDQLGYDRGRQYYLDKLNKQRAKETALGAKTGHIVGEGRAIAGGIETGANALGSAISGGIGAGGGGISAGGGGYSAPTATPNYYFGYGQDLNNQINKIGNYR